MSVRISLSSGAWPSPLRTSAFSRTDSIAQKTASGVAGAASSTLTPAGPNDAAAWRSASRTQKASISGGSPTALDPYTAPSSVAFSISVTLNSSGISEKLGSL